MSLMVDVTADQPPLPGRLAVQNLCTGYLGHPFQNSIKDSFHHSCSLLSPHQGDDMVLVR